MNESKSITQNKLDQNLASIFSSNVESSWKSILNWQDKSNLFPYLMNQPNQKTGLNLGSNQYNTESEIKVKEYVPIDDVQIISSKKHTIYTWLPIATAAAFIGTILFARSG